MFHQTVSGLFVHTSVYVKLPACIGREETEGSGLFHCFLLLR